MSNVLVTGGAGFIGSNLADLLLKNKHNVRVLDNLATGELKNLESAKEIDLLEGSITDKDTVKKAVKGIDYVFHMAAQVSVPLSIENPLLTENVNVNGTLNLLEASKNAGVRRLVFSSSCAVYGEAAAGAIREDTNKNPLSPYAVSKLAAENQCLSFSRLAGLETICLRYFNVYGPRQSPDSQYAAVIPKFITLLLGKRQPVIFGDGGQSRDFVFVSDVVHANLLAMRTRKASGEVFNIGSGTASTINELAREISSIIGVDIKPKYAKPRAGEIRHSLADISKAKKILGYKPKYNLEKGLKETIDWFSKER